MAIHRLLKVFIIWTSILWIVLDNANAQNKDITSSLGPLFGFNTSDGFLIGGKWNLSTKNKWGIFKSNIGLSLLIPTRQINRPFAYRLGWNYNLTPHSFTEPFIISFNSSFSTGYHNHYISLSKRWQRPFNEKVYTNLRIRASLEKTIYPSYFLYPHLWERAWFQLWKVSLGYHNSNEKRREHLEITSTFNLPLLSSFFTSSTIQYHYRMIFSRGFSLKARLFTGITLSKAPQQFRFFRSIGPAITWLESYLGRASIIPKIIQKGHVEFTQVGAGLRGYLFYDIRQLSSQKEVLFSNISSLNIELSFPNYIDFILQKDNFLGKWVYFDTYFFLDMGTQFSNLEKAGLLADMGLGSIFYLDLTDYKGRFKGIALRFDTPFFVNQPERNEPKWKFRWVLGLQTIIEIH